MRTYEDARLLYIPKRATLRDRGFMPPPSLILTDQAASMDQRESSYFLNPRLMMTRRIGLGGFVDDVQRMTSGYALPVVVGGLLGYLMRKKTGAFAGAVLGGLAKWGIDRARVRVSSVIDSVMQQASDAASSLSPTTTSTDGLGGFWEDLQVAWDPTQPASEAPANTYQRGALRVAQIGLGVSLVTLILELNERRQQKSRSRSRSKTRSTSTTRSRTPEDDQEF